MTYAVRRNILGPNNPTAVTQLDTYIEECLEDSPQGLWMLDDPQSGNIALDLSSNNDHGTYVGTDPRRVRSFGPTQLIPFASNMNYSPNRAFPEANKKGYVRVRSEGEIEFGPPITIEFAMKLNSTMPGLGNANNRIFQAGNPLAGGQGMVIFGSLQNGLISLSLSSSGGGASAHWSVPSMDQWNFYSFVIPISSSDSDQLSLRVNGSEAYLSQPPSTYPAWNGQMSFDIGGSRELNPTFGWGRGADCWLSGFGFYDYPLTNSRRDAHSDALGISFPASGTVSVFTDNSTWVKPEGAGDVWNTVTVYAVGGGGGGGGGRRASNSRTGGAGGGGGDRVVQVFDHTDFNDWESVIVGTGGAGGATSGSSGSDGGVSSFTVGGQIEVVAESGKGGSGATGTGSPLGGAGGGDTGGDGGRGSIQVGPSLPSSDGSFASGGGGGQRGGNLDGAYIAGSGSDGDAGAQGGPGGFGGNTSYPVGQDGNPGQNGWAIRELEGVILGYAERGGGGGGGGSGQGAQTGNGGRGGFPGGGGGGGAGAYGGGDSGSGGDGADGIVVVVCTLENP